MSESIRIIVISPFDRTVMLEMRLRPGRNQQQEPPVSCSERLVGCLHVDLNVN